MWSTESKSAYLACAIDTDGWIGLRTTKRKDNSYRLSPNVGVTNTSKEFLTRFAELADVPLNISLNGKVGRDTRGIITRNEVFQCYWRSPIHVIKILTLAYPYLLAKQERALWTLEYCQSRITPSGLVYRSGKPYTERDWELARLVTTANGRAIPLEMIT